MNLKVLLSWAVAIVLALGQPDRFTLDPSRPFVYVKFDHFGSRKPIRQGEESKGLWLRLVNNCRLPIIVTGFDLGTGELGIGLNYEVHAMPGADAPREESARAEGYSFHVGSPVVVAPGKDVMFSIPANHVSQTKYIELEFRFKLASPRSGEHPRGVVAFEWSGLPTEKK